MLVHEYKLRYFLCKSDVGFYGLQNNEKIMSIQI